MDGENVRKLRLAKGWTQSELAEKVYSTKRTIINWEGGSNIPANKIALLERAFSSEQQSSGEILEFESENDIPVKDAQEIYFLENTNGNSFEKLPNDFWKITVDLISVKAYARYVSDVNDAEHIDGYQQVSFIVDKYARGNYKAFEVKGDSMDDGSRDSTPDKAIALARELGRQHWKSFRDATYGWIIVTKNNIVFKDIVSQDLSSGTITCHSRNPSPEYGDFMLSLDEDVRQIFKVIKRQF